MKLNPWIRLLTLVTAFGTLGTIAFAEDTAPHEHGHSKKAAKKADMKAPSPEQRKEMAKLHQQMADCLKSDKPMSECREQMMKDCPMKTKDGECPMMKGAHSHD